MPKYVSKWEKQQKSRENRHFCIYRKSVFTR